MVACMYIPRLDVTLLKSQKHFKLNINSFGFSAEILDIHLKLDRKIW